MRILAALPVLTLAPAMLMADDWPQWLGPNRDGVYHEQNVVEALPADGLPVKWRQPAKTGYAGPAVAGGKVYLFEYEITEGELAYQAGTPDKLEGLERVRCLSADTGEELWKHEYPCRYSVSYGGGPRCTP
ncbi:MAG: pyrrolo-quinoline quinone, partial [Planctomycetales bacterium]|nr:pyrrolo-quinoline quinone [Planctomycetales bacterium]